MENNLIKSSVLISIFKRKGCEGAMTKIINNQNKLNYLNQIATLSVDEEPIICFKENELNWVLITNLGILVENKGIRLVIHYSELVDVSLAIKEEFNHKIMNKEDFTRLAFKARNGNDYIVKFEKGGPLQGIYQMLHYVVSNRD